jgi:hypothetical protein
MRLNCRGCNVATKTFWDTSNYCYRTVIVVEPVPHARLTAPPPEPEPERKNKWTQRRLENEPTDNAKRIAEYLREHGTATTQQIAELIGKSVKATHDILDYNPDMFDVVGKQSVTGDRGLKYTVRIWRLADYG